MNRKGDRPLSAVIEAEHLRKTFGSLVAVDDLSFSVAAGECFGILGPNGAGKTSTIRMVCAVSPPSGGTHSTIDTNGPFAILPASFDASRAEGALRSRGRDSTAGTAA